MADLNFYNIIIFFIILSFLFQVVLDKMQIKYLTNNLNFIPERFRENISIDDHKKSIEYAKDKLDHRIKRNVVEILFLGMLTFGGFLDYLTQYAYAFSASLEIDAVLAGSLLVLLFYCIVFLVDVPFSLYKQFVIEERHGFNKMTFRLWLTDLAKNAALSGILIFPYIPFLFLITNRMEIGALVDPAVGISCSFVCVLYDYFPINYRSHFQQIFPIENGLLKERLEKLLLDVNLNQKAFYYGWK